MCVGQLGSRSTPARAPAHGQQALRSLQQQPPGQALWQERGVCDEVPQRKRGGAAAAQCGVTPVCANCPQYT